MTRRAAPSDLFLRTLRFKPVAMHMSLRTLTIALAGLTLTACAKRSAERTMAPAEAEADAGPTDIDALEAELAAREDQLRALGAGPAGDDEEALADRDTRGPAAGDGGKAEAMAKATEAQAGAGQSAPPVASSAPPEPLARTPGRCAQVCDITAAICQLRDNICGLAPGHPDEPRYQRACDRATVDCTFATEACDACA